MSIFVQNVLPLTTSKTRINVDDLENPLLPDCDRKYWIVDSGKVREMTADEKEEYYPTPKTSEEDALKSALSETDIGMARVAEDVASRLDSLIEKLSELGVIKQGDVPELSEAAKEKISAREELRSQLAALE